MRTVLIVVWLSCAVAFAQTLRPRPPPPRRIVPRRRILNVTASAEELHKRFFRSTVNDPGARPVARDDKAVDVTFKFLLTGIRSLDPVTHTLTASALLCLFWKEPRISWQRRRFGNITSIRVKDLLIWTPNIRPPQSKALEVETGQSAAVIDNTGGVSRCVFSELRSLCRLNLASFPYDEHTCKIHLRPNGLSSQKLNLIFENVTDTNVIRYGEWEIFTVKAYTHFNTYSPTLQIGTAVIELRVRRCSQHFRWSVCVPTVSLLLVILTSFWLPKHQLRARQSLFYGLLLGTILLLRYTAEQLEGAQQLPNVLLLQTLCLALLLGGILSAALQQALRISAKVSTQRIGLLDRYADNLSSIIGKLDSFGFPSAGVVLIVWLFFS